MNTHPSTLANKAATARLIAAHRAEYDAILAEERTARGLAPVPMRGRPVKEKRPVPPVLRALRPGTVTPALGVSLATWHRWLNLGIPAERAADVATATGLPVEVLWPEVAA